VLVASPQIVAMAQQAVDGGAALPASMLAHQDTRYGVPLDSMFAPSPRTKLFGLHAVASIFHYQARKEGVPTFGVMLTLLALLGLVVAWRRPAARLFGLAWLACAVVALGSVLRIGHQRLVPLAIVTHGVRMSVLLPYTWLIHLPGLSGLREPDRFMLLGLLPAALLAGFAAEWLLRRAVAVLVVALALAVLEAGFSGSPFVGTMPTAIPRLDAPIAADHSGSIVVDVPFGLGGGLGIDGRSVSAHALVEATADGHPRAVSVTSWVPAPTVHAIQAHPFYRDLLAVEAKRGPVPTLTAGQLRAARQDALRMRVGWAIVWKPASAGPVIGYLRQVGFRFARKVGNAELYRLAPATGGHTGRSGCASRARSARRHRRALAPARSPRTRPRPPCRHRSPGTARPVPRPGRPHQRQAARRRPRRARGTRHRRQAARRRPRRARGTRHHRARPAPAARGRGCASSWCWRSTWRPAWPPPGRGPLT